MGDRDGAAVRYRAIHDDLLEKGRVEEALDALRQVVRLKPQDHAGRAALARTAVQAGQLDAAAEFLTREAAGDDPNPPRRARRDGAECRPSRGRP